MCELIEPRQNAQQRDCKCTGARGEEEEGGRRGGGKKRRGGGDGGGGKANLLALPPNSVVSPSIASLPPALQCQSGGIHKHALARV